MKTKILNWSFFAVLVITAVSFLVFSAMILADPQEQDDIFGPGFSIFILAVAYFPLLLTELSVYLYIRYFIRTENTRNLLKTLGYSLFVVVSAAIFWLIIVRYFQIALPYAPTLGLGFLLPLLLAAWIVVLVKKRRAAAAILLLAFFLCGFLNAWGLFPTRFPYVDGWIKGKTQTRIEAVYGEPDTEHGNTISYYIGRTLLDPVPDYYHIYFDSTGHAYQIITGVGFGG